MNTTKTGSELLEARFAKLYADHGRALARLAAAYEADGDARQDLLQEILFAIWRALPSFRGDSSERTFIFRIGHNRALSYRRKRRVRFGSLDDAPEDKQADPSPNPEATAVNTQRHEFLMTSVRQLPPGYRQVVILSLEGLSPGEGADVLGMTTNNFSVRLSRARKMLGKALREAGA